MASEPIYSSEREDKGITRPVAPPTPGYESAREDKGLEPPLITSEASQPPAPSRSARFKAAAQNFVDWKATHETSSRFLWAIGGFSMGGPLNYYSEHKQESIFWFPAAVWSVILLWSYARSLRTLIKACVGCLVLFTGAAVLVNFEAGRAAAELAGRVPKPFPRMFIVNGKLTVTPGDPGDVALDFTVINTGTEDGKFWVDEGNVLVVPHSARKFPYIKPPEANPVTVPAVKNFSVGQKFGSKLRLLESTLEEIKAEELDLIVFFRGKYVGSDGVVHILPFAVKYDTAFPSNISRLGADYVFE